MEGLQIICCQIQSIITRNLHLCREGWKVKMYVYMKSCAADVSNNRWIHESVTTKKKKKKCFLEARVLWGSA